MKKDFYCCVIHNRLTGAGQWMSYERSVRKAAVAFCGKVHDNPFTCTDCDKTLTIKINADMLNIQFAWITTGDDGKQTIRPSEHIEIPYEVGIKTVYNVPLCDAMESWCFMVSYEPIDPDSIMNGYRKGNDGLFYSIKDEDEQRKEFDTMTKDVNRKEKALLVLSVAGAIVIFLVLLICTTRIV